MGDVGAPLYKIASTEYRCAGCGIHFEVYWQEFDGGKPQEAKATCPLAGCGSEARQVRDNLTVDLRRLAEKVESMERRLWPHHAARNIAPKVQEGLPPTSGHYSPLRLRILNALLGQPMKYGELCSSLGAPGSSLWKALQGLIVSGLIRKGLYKLSPYEITEEGRHAYAEACK